MFILPKATDAGLIVCVYIHLHLNSRLQKTRHVVKIVQECHTTTVQDHSLKLVLIDTVHLISY